MHSQNLPDQLRRKAIALQWITIAWMTVECVLSLRAGNKANSMALLTFSGDSGVELASGVVVLLRFYRWRVSEKLASRVAALLLVLLAALTVLGISVSLLIPGSEPKPSLLGIAVLVVAALIMPGLGRAKRSLATSIQSSALRADAAQSSLCSYFSLISLAGILMNWAFHWPKADLLASAVLLPLILREAWEGWRGAGCAC